MLYTKISFRGSVKKFISSWKQAISLTKRKGSSKNDPQKRFHKKKIQQKEDPAKRRSSKKKAFRAMPEKPSRSIQFFRIRFLIFLICKEVRSSCKRGSLRPLCSFRMRSMQPDGRSSLPERCACKPGFSAWSTW